MRRAWLAGLLLIGWVARADAEPIRQWRLLIGAHDGRLRIERQVAFWASAQKLEAPRRDGALALRVLDAEGRVLHRAWIADPRRARVALGDGHVELSLPPIPFTIRVAALAQARAIEIDGLGRVELPREPK